MAKNKKIETPKTVSKKIEEDKVEISNQKFTKETHPKTPVSQIITYLFLALSFVTTITFFLYTVATSSNIVEQISVIIRVSILTLFSISFIFVCLFSVSKKGQVFVIIASLLLTAFSGIQLLEETNILKFPTQSYVENFTNRSLTEVIAWSEANHITVEQIYETSETVPEYYIISQSVEAGTLLNAIDKIQITVSNGPDKEKEVIFPNMIGKSVDDVITFVETNYFTNVTIDFIVSEEEKDLIIDQDKSGQLPRNEEIHITASIGADELGPIEMESLIDRTTFYATTWLKRNGIKYEITYDYSDSIAKGNVISQSIEPSNTVNPNNDTVTLTISKGSKIDVPNLMNMTMEEITAWVVKNRLKIEFTDKYDDSTTLGKPISVSHKEGDTLEEGATIKVTISKGQLKMEEFSSVEEYRSWAEKYGITIKEEIEFSDSVASGGIIKTSHAIGTTIRNGDVVIITVSQGKELTVPNLIGKTKSQIQSACNDASIKCNFIYGSYSETVAKDIATKQSRASGSKIASGTTVTITLSRGIIEKVTVPSFIGQNRSNIQTTCNNLGITCNFVTESTFSSTPAGNATRQSNSGKINKGSTITVYLSKGPAQSFTITIQATWFGNTYNETVATLKSKLESACPGVTFQFKAKDVNEGSGMISSDSAIKVGKHTFVQGQTYTITVNR